MKIDKDALGLDLSKDTMDNLNEKVSKLREVFDSKKEELLEVDKTRGLYSLSKAVKEVAVYPPAFGAGTGEDVFKFKEKFVEAVNANQVREKDKIEVLRKHLKGKAKDIFGDHYESFDVAIKALVNMFGQAQVTWESKLKKFFSECNKPLVWINFGS